MRSREVSYWNRAWEPFLTTRNPVVTYDPTEEGTTNTNLPPHLNVNLSHFIKPTQQWLHLSVRGAFSHMGLTKWQSKQLKINPVIPKTSFSESKLKVLLKTFLKGQPGWAMEGTHNHLKTHQGDKRNLAKHSILIHRKDARDNTSPVLLWTEPTI